MNEFDPLIDAALDSVPLSPTPAGLVPSTMKRISPLQEVRFRIEFLDVAIPAFLTFFLLVLGTLVIWLLNSLNPLWVSVLQARWQWLTFYAMSIPVQTFLAAGGMSVMLLVCVGLLAAGWMYWPQSIRSS